MIVNDVLPTERSLEVRDHWIGHSARLSTLARMVAAAASEADCRHCSRRAHGYLDVLIEHLSCCGHATWDGDTGLACATQQLLLLTTCRRVIASAVSGSCDASAASDLLALTTEYEDLTRRTCRCRLGHEVKRRVPSSLR